MVYLVIYGRCDRRGSFCCECFVIPLFFRAGLNVPLPCVCISTNRKDKCIDLYFNSNNLALDIASINYVKRNCKADVGSGYFGGSFVTFSRAKYIGVGKGLESMLT